MIDYASKHLDPALTPQILLKSANLIKEIVWVSKRGNNLKKTTKKNSFLVIYVVALWVNAGYILYSFQVQRHPPWKHLWSWLENNNSTSHRPAGPRAVVTAVPQQNSDRNLG